MRFALFFWIISDLLLCIDCGCGEECNWISWETWSECSASCSGGTRYRTREICCPEEHEASHNEARSMYGVPSDCLSYCDIITDDFKEYGDCNTHCYNGGSYISSEKQCICSGPWYGTCCNTPCKPIANCEVGHLNCTDAYDQFCGRCQYDRGGERKAFEKQVFNRSIQLGWWRGTRKVVNSRCQRICSWRPDSLYCYPGICPGNETSCQCAPGFEGENCMTVTKNVPIPVCLATLEETNNGSVVDFVKINCSESNIVYTNERPSVLHIDWAAYFHGPNQTAYPQPYYIYQFAVGLISTKARFTFNNETNQAITYDCNKTLSRDNPHFGIQPCVGNVPFDSETVHGNSLLIEVEAVGGGFVQINNYDNPDLIMIDEKRYYTNNTNKVNVTVIFDYLPPTHCSIGGCNDTWLDVDNHFINDGEIDLRWSGWYDELADIELYEVEVSLMESVGNVSSCKSTVAKWNGTSDTTFLNISGSPAGMYCVVLTVVDRAGNFIHSRKFVLYDHISNITLGHNSKIQVTTASANSSLQWITTLEKMVKVTWKGHFCNNYHMAHNLLLGIKSANISGDLLFEDTSGQPPLTRSREAIPNINGIIRYDVAVMCGQTGWNVSDHAGLNWTRVNDFIQEEETFNISREDGDVVRIFVKAYDAMYKTRTEFRDVYVDSSPPVIADMWLSRHGHGQLAVHHSEELYTLNLKLDLYDYHSGLKTVHWELHDMENTSRIHGQGKLPVARPSVHSPACPPPDCYCIPKGDCFFRNFTLTPNKEKMDMPEGNHDFDYYFVITITNNAMLQTTDTFKITVDTSPPHAGVVKDSTPGNIDLDYQGSLTLHAWWDGFFDKQSGILFYQYHFGHKCLGAKDFMVPEPKQVSRTFETFASVNVTSHGKYYVTVVAYNAALEPSVPVCSDGITVDTTPPDLHSVTINGIGTHEGLATDAIGQLWYINTKREKFILTDSSVNCSDREMTIIDDLETYPNMTLKQYEIDKIDCQLLPESKNFAYLGNQNMLDFSWFGEDIDSSIYDYKVGLSSAGSADMDVLPYESTHGHRHFISYHPGLGDASTVYIHIVAINRAGTETEKIIGPVFAYTSNPIFDGDITLGLVKVDGKDFLKASWNFSYFDEGQLTNDLISKFENALGSAPYSENIKNYKSIDNHVLHNMTCLTAFPPTCSYISTSNLDWNIHSNHIYYFTLKLVGANGLYTVVTSQPYIHMHGPPKPGMVMEVLTENNNTQVHDIQQQTRTDAIKIRWSGFYHPELDISYSVGVGTSPEMVDIVPYKSVGSNIEEFLIDGLALMTFQKYYSHVRAESVEGETQVSSDGILILPKDAYVPDNITVYDGYKCSLINGNPQQHESFMHQPNMTTHTECNQDIDFQTSYTSLSGFWEIPPSIRPIITTVMVGIDVFNTEFSEWRSLTEPVDVGHVDDVRFSDLHLDTGKKFRLSVLLCHAEGCFKPIKSNGVNILQPNMDKPKIVNSNIFKEEPEVFSTSTSTQNLETTTTQSDPLSTDGTNQWSTETNDYTSSTTAEYTTHDSSSTALPEVYPLNMYINMSWYHPDYTGSVDSIPLTYEWNILVDHQNNQHGGYLYNWQLVNMSTVKATFDENNQTIYNAVVQLPYILKQSSCYKLVIRAISPVHQVADDSFELDGCDVPQRVISNTVIDAVGTFDPETETISDIHLNDNDFWPEPDKAYTPSKSMLSAAWPGLWHENFGWKVVSDGYTEQWSYKQSNKEMKYSDYHCASPEVLACGVTKDNFVNVHDLVLNHGQRYHICIHANATTAEFEKFDQALSEIDTCSNGVVSDHHPPEQGRVWIGTPCEEWNYQIGSTTLHIYWDGFSDVERWVKADHESGIKKYKYSIGSYPGGNDVKEMTVVGLANMATAENLRLKSGTTYYVTLEAMDYAGRSTSVTSDGITIDTSQPDITGDIDAGPMYIPRLENAKANWQGVFVDIESGISHYRWCIGTRKLFCDVLPYISTHNQYSGIISENTTIPDGAEFYFTVQAVNRVGLLSQFCSHAVVIDTTPPIGGFVNDIRQNVTDTDIDVQVYTDKYSARWGGFSDSHSPITHYYITIGQCVDCDDILQEMDFTHSKEIHLNHLELEEGRRYYTKVRVCNAAGLCTSLTSDGAISDTTPPVMGPVLDGITGDDINYQISRHTLGAHWINAHDVHSGLSYFTWWAGTTPGGSDVHLPAQLHLVDKVTVLLPSSLPVGVKIYTTVEATDLAGFRVTRASNGFIVDTSGPIFDTLAHFDPYLGSFYQNTQIWTTSLTINWSARDEESQIKETYLSVLSHTFDHVLIPTTKLLGNFRNYTFSNVSLSDGERYRVKVSACNLAHLCNSSITEPILVDNSPPTPGAFAVDTEHAAALTRHRDGHMTYQTLGGTTTLHLAWLGFSDPHSDILQYHIIIGTGFAKADILGARKPGTIEPQQTESHKDEGFLHNTSVIIGGDLKERRIIYVTIWAENKVGLMSQKLHGTFTMVPSGGGRGTLELSRRCEVVSCAGHCTCAPKHHICSTADSCTNVTGMDGYKALIVKDITNYRSTDEPKDESYTRSQCAMVASWNVTGDQGVSPYRFEWSVGLKGRIPGFELLKQELIWREAGRRNVAVYTSHGTVTKASLLKLSTYIFFIRAWYDEQHYGIYTSDGIQTDRLSPETSKYYKVKELKGPGSAIDSDFITSDSGVYVTWDKVFRDREADIASYTVTIGTYPGAADIYTADFNSLVSAAYIDVALVENQKYFTSVTAFNEAGLYTTAMSDGFMVEMTKPLPGIVREGVGLTDVDYIHYTADATLDVYWRGFSDLGAGLERYSVCLGTSAGSADVATCQDVSLATQHTFKLPQDLANGQRLFTTVSAMDGAGHVSDPVSSDGIVIDLTPPQPEQRFILGDNLIMDPRLENVNTSGLSGEWDLIGKVRMQSYSSVNSSGFDAFVHITEGEVSQTVSTDPGDKYKLEFYTKPSNDMTGHYTQSFGFVKLAGNQHQFSVVATNSYNNWSRHTYFLVSIGTTARITLGASGRRNSFYLRDVGFQRVGEGERPVHPDPDHPEADDTEPIHVNVGYHGNYVTITASWDVVDPESTVTKNMWAIGSVKGGTQLQSYRSVGHHTQARNEMLLVPHGLEIHVSVVVENAAGLTTLIHSDPVIVDHTPPQMCCLTDENGDPDINLASLISTIKWDVSDDESGVSHCKVSAGHNPGSGELFLRKLTDSKMETELHMSTMEMLDKFYVTIECWNYVGLTSFLQSGPIYVTLNPPDVSAMFVNVITKSMTLYPSRDAHHADRDRLLIGWGGMTYNKAVDKLQISIKSSGKPFLPWVDIRNTHARYAVLDDLVLPSDGLYTVDVRLVNTGGKASSMISTNFTLQTTPPTLTGIKPTTTWINEWTLALDWSDAFTSTSSLIYEITIGTRPGGMEVLPWTETTASQMRVTGVDSSKHQYITLTAINKAGLYTTTMLTASYENKN